MNILHETAELVLEYEHESTWLKNKLTGEVLFEEDFYGDPTCGLIDVNNKWAIAAGEHLIVWTPTELKKITELDVHSLRLKNFELVEILTDPWSDSSSIWELDLRLFEIKKIREFRDYRDKEYVDKVIW